MLSAAAAANMTSTASNDVQIATTQQWQRWTIITGDVGPVK